MVELWNHMTAMVELWNHIDSYGSAAGLRRYCITSDMCSISLSSSDVLLKVRYIVLKRGFWVLRAPPSALFLITRCPVCECVVCVHVCVCVCCVVTCMCDSSLLSPPSPHTHSPTGCRTILPLSFTLNNTSH